MSIKAIIFDIGNVLIFVNHLEVCEKLSGWGGSSQEIYQYIFASGIETAFDKGIINADVFYNSIKKNFNLDISFKDFTATWSSGFSPNHSIYPLIKFLRHHYFLCLLSNTNQIHFEYIREKFSILSEFRAFLLSYQLGVRKPDRLFFLKAIDFLKFNPNECVFIDDVEEYIESANKVGINGILYQGVPSLKISLNKLNVRLPSF